jgi:hypothetical protein
VISYSDAIESFLSGRSSPKADIIIGCPESVANRLKAVFAGRRKADNQTVHVIYNNSTAPVVRNATIFAAGTTLLYVHANQVFTILHKDKTRSLLTACGGTTNDEDKTEEKAEDQTEEKAEDQANSYQERTARRELREETTGEIFVDGKVMRAQGFRVGRMEKVATVKMVNIYFGVECQDEYTRFGAWLDEMDPLVAMIFHQDNKQEDGCFRLDFKNHAETEYLLATPVIPAISIPITESLDNIVKQKRRKEISTMSLFLDQVFLCHYWKGAWAQGHPALPPSFRSFHFDTQEKDVSQQPQEPKEQKRRVDCEGPPIDPIPIPQYNADRAKNMLDFIHDDLVRGTATYYLKTIQEKNARITSMCAKKYPRNFLTVMKTEVYDIRRLGTNLQRLAPNVFSFVETTIQKPFTIFQEMLEEKLEMTEEERQQLEQKTTHLWQSQATNHFSLLQTLPHRALVNAKRCYFSYAWPTPKQAQTESWVQPFLEYLREELQSAGIRCLLDSKDCGAGENSDKFMREGIELSHVVFLFGTRSLLEKHFDDKCSNVQTELAMIHQKSSGVIPVLLTGTIRSSIPIVDARSFESYPMFVRYLVSVLDKM